MGNRGTFVSVIVGILIIGSLSFGFQNSAYAGVLPEQPTARVLKILEDGTVGGTVGLYLKEVNGSVLAEHEHEFIFEPASTIKVTHFVNALDRIPSEFEYTDSVDFFQNFDAVDVSCPVDTGPSSNTLEFGLGRMMVNSDNRWTQAFRVLLGENNINDTMQTLGMTDSLTQARIGCGTSGTDPPEDNAVAKPNQLTLVDAGKLYEEVANGFLTDQTDKFYEIIDNDNGSLDIIINQEVGGLGLSSEGLADFKSERDSALKAGSYGLSTGTFRSTAGWVELPFKDSSCNISPQEYVYGAFIHAADSLVQDDIRTQGIELFREEILAALVTWADCETDLSIEKTGPSNPVVAGTQITYTVTVENEGPNDATNVVVADTLSAGLIFDSTSGCAEDDDGVPTCSLGNIADGNSKSFDITVDIPADFVYNGGTVVGNEAEVSADQFDFNPDNNDDAIENDVIAEADVEILTFEASETPAEVLLGDSFDVTLTKTITNNGISSPVDVDAQVQASGAGVSIVPPQVLPGVDELDKDEVDEIIEDFTVTCEEPGLHEIVFSNEITPVNAVDTKLGNNEAEVTIEVDCVIAVQINIHPASDPNSINIVKRTGVIPVAILSTLAGEYGLPIDVDATMVDPSSVHFGPFVVLFNVNPPGGATEFHNKGHIEDSYELDETTQDGDDDMLLHFKAKQTELDETDTEGCVKGKIDIGGMSFTFFGCDDINVPP